MSNMVPDEIIALDDHLTYMVSIVAMSWINVGSAILICDSMDQRSIVLIDDLPS